MAGAAEKTLLLWLIFVRRMNQSLQFRFQSGIHLLHCVGGGGRLGWLGHDNGFGILATTTLWFSLLTGCRRDPHELNRG